ncbi:MAG: hypothetical protein ABIP44_02745 [Pseudoxanthomonas sp.]
MHTSVSGTCKASVHVGMHGRVHIFLGHHAPSLVGTREEMQQLATMIQTACGMPEPFIEGDLQSCNDDIHPREQTA